MKTIPPRERLIFAMDVADPAAARGLVEVLGESVEFYKIGLELFMSGGYFELLDWLARAARRYSSTSSSSTCPRPWPRRYASCAVAA